MTYKYAEVSAQYREPGLVARVEKKGRGTDRRRRGVGDCGKPAGGFSKWLWEGAKRLSKGAVGNLWAAGGGREGAGRRPGGWGIGGPGGGRWAGGPGGPSIGFP